MYGEAAQIVLAILKRIAIPVVCFAAGMIIDHRHVMADWRAADLAAQSQADAVLNAAVSRANSLALDAQQSRYQIEVTRSDHAQQITALAADNQRLLGERLAERVRACPRPGDRGSLPRPAGSAPSGDGTADSGAGDVFERVARRAPAAAARADEIVESLRACRAWIAVAQRTCGKPNPPKR